MAKRELSIIRSSPSGFCCKLRSQGGERYELAFLMVGRLLEVPRQKAETLFNALRKHSRHILLYAYPGYGGRSFDQLLGAAGITVEVEPGAVCAVLRGQ